MRARTAPATADAPARPRARGDGHAPDPSRPLASVVVGAVAFAVYLGLAPHVSGDRDSSEFTLVLALDGIAHPTGYPLYTLFGHGFVVAAHALGAGWALAANAWSALGGGVALAFMHALAARLIPGSAVVTTSERRWLPVIPAALLLVNPAWTQVTTVAEVYSWHLAWALALALAFVSRRSPGVARRASAELEPGFPAGWGALCGIGLAHHATSLLLVIPWSVALIASARPDARRALRWLAMAAAAALVPLASYLPMRVKMAHDGPARWTALEDSWAGFWTHITGAQYGGLFGRFAPEPMDRQLIESAVLPFLIPALAVLALGCLWPPRAPRRRTLAWLLVAALVQLAFAFLYGVDDPSAHLLPALALGFVALAPMLAALSATAGWGRAGGRALAVAIVLVTLALAPHWTRAALDLRAAFTGLDGLLHATWARIPVERGIVLWPHDMHQRLHEYQWLDGEKPGLDVVNPWTFTNPAARRRFARRHGFDPAAGLSLAREDLLAPGAATPGARIFLDGVAQRINAHTELPVILFEPEVPRVTRMSKGPGPRSRLDGPAGAR